MRWLFAVFLLVATVARAADWALPSTAQGAWTPNTTAGTPGVGIPGGFDQYLAGGANDRAVTGTVHDVTASPYFVAPNNNQTTGTITSGTTLLTVANAAGFEVGNYIRCGSAETFQTSRTVVESGATSTGTITITLDTGAFNVSVTAGNSASTVASAIRATSFTGYTTGGSGTTVTYKATSAGYKGPPSVAAGGTGVGTTNDISLYVTNNFQIASKSGNDLTLAHPADVGATGGAVTHNASVGVAAAWAAASSGDVIYFPAGTYYFPTSAINTQYKDNITIRGASSATVTWVIATTSNVVQWGSPGEPNHDPQTVTGTKTKGTATLTVSDTSAYTDGDHVMIRYENEVDNTRIEAGSPPTFTSRGYPEARQLYAKVIGKTSTTITIDPALPGDGTNLTLKVYSYPNPLRGASWTTSGIGVENISVSFASSSHPLAVFQVTTGEYCWFYDVKFLNWSMNESNGSCIGLFSAYRCEVRKCSFTASSGASSDGAVGVGSLSSSLVVDNIMTGKWDSWVYDNGKSNNNVYAYNYSPDNNSIFHSAHPSLNVVEGNYAYLHQSDGYHGSSSDNTIYGNFFHGGGSGGSGWFSVVVNRFKRRYNIARNFLGEDGVASGRILWGTPNFNPFADGFAGPTGLSDQVGETVYHQPGYGVYSYVVQAGDVAAGDFWDDWKTTATLTTRTSDTEGVFTVSGGRWFVGDAPTAGNILPAAWWNSKANSIGAYNNETGTVTAVSGSLVTIQWSAGGPLPIVGTSFEMYYGPAGWQELDLDAQASSVLTHNYFASGSGTGALQNTSGDTFPDSLVWTSKPAWVGSLPWPIFDVDDASTADVERLPAAYRYINGNEDYLGGVSTPQFSPAPGTYASAQTVTITSGTPSATIYYTINGTTPTTSSTLYTGPVTLPGTTTTLKALAVKSGLDDSSVQSGTYTISGGGGGGAGNATISTLNVGTLALP
jgi:hypothetical protein